MDHKTEIQYMPSEVYGYEHPYVCVQVDEIFFMSNKYDTLMGETGKVIATISSIYGVKNSLDPKSKYKDIRVVSIRKSGESKSILWKEFECKYNEPMSDAIKNNLIECCVWAYEKMHEFVDTGEIKHE